MANPKHKPTAKDRATAKAMLGYGMKQDDVARVIGISDVTLRLHYAQEIATAEPEANAQVAQSLFQMATRGKNVAAAIWWSKTRMGWKETVNLGNATEGQPFLVGVITGVTRPGDENS